jgi:opacity protein-like surface antigen
MKPDHCHSSVFTKSKQKSKLATAFLLSIISLSSLADERFNSFYGGIGLGTGFTRMEGLQDSSHIPGSKPWKSEIMEDQWVDNRVAYITAGKDWNLGNNLVTGLVFDYSASNAKKTAIEQENPIGDYFTLESKRASSLRFRLGYLVTDNVLVYGSAGVARLKNKFTSYDEDQGSEPTLQSKSFTKTAPVIGGGVNWVSQSNHDISYQVEGLYYMNASQYKFGNQELSLDMDEGDYARVKNILTIRFGVNYHF